MKKIFYLIWVLGVLISTPTWALQIEIRNKQNKLITTDQQKISGPISVGQLTLQVLIQAQNTGFIKSFVADESGVYSIENLGSDLEILADNEMRAWGWCFSIDNFIPETLAGQTLLAGQENQLLWFYGFAHYKDGAWVSQCER